MKKLFYLLLLVVLTNTAYSQLEVKDTVLLAFQNDQFWSSSSELQQGMYKDLGKYGSVNLGDSDPSTCWAEGADNDGSGEYILTIIPKDIVKIRIRNGYQKNETIYKANNRPKNIEFSVCALYELGGYVTETHTGFCISEPLFTSTAILEDRFGYQDVNLTIDWPAVYKNLSTDKNFDKDRFILKIKIIDVYKGNKWNDACISDINIIPSPYLNLTEDEHGFIKVFNSKTDTLFYNPESIFQTLEVSQNAEWIIFIEMPYEIENSRVENIYRLFNTKKEDFVKLDNVNAMYGFVKKENKLYLEGSDNQLNLVSICLDEL